MPTVCPKKTLWLWQLRILLAGGLLTAASAFAAMLSRWLLLIPAVFLAATLFLIFWYIPRFFESFSLSFPNGALTVSRGVWIRTTFIMPYSGLVYAQSFSTPLAKRMGLAGLMLKAARSRLTLPELAAHEVAEILNLLSKEGTP